MTINYTKNDYFKVDNYNNVVNERGKYQSHEGALHVIHSELAPLVQKLALRHPEWTFVGEESGFGTMTNAYIIKDVRVYEGHEVIGYIRVATWNDTKFEIRNYRISKSMHKRSYKSTKDMNKAIKIVESEFATKTPSEVTVEAVGKVSSVLSDRKWRTDREFNNVWGKVTPAMLTYIALNMDRMKPILEGYGAPAASIDELIPLNERIKTIRSIATAHHDEKGALVILYKDRYIVQRNGTTEMLTASQLDEDTRTKLGVLKLVEDEEVIDGFGVRISQTTFYLLP